MHWYELDAQNRICNRRDIQISIDRTKFTMVPKAEARPYLIDWNRDGIQDLILALRVADGSTASPSTKYQPKLFVKLGSKSRNRDIESSLRENEKRQKPPATIFAPKGGADLIVNFNHFDFDNGIEKRWNDLNLQGWRVYAEFAFGDVDNDGNVDLILSEDLRRVAFNEQTGRFQLADIQNAIYWMRNESLGGEPKFSSPQKIYTPEKNQILLSIAASDIDQDGRLDLITQSGDGSINLLSQVK